MWGCGLCGLDGVVCLGAVVWLGGAVVQDGLGWRCKCTEVRVVLFVCSGS